MNDQSSHHDSLQVTAQHASARAKETWLTVLEVAARLRVSRDTVERWIHAGLLRAVNVSAANTAQRRRPCWRIAPASLDSFIEGRVNLPLPPVTRPRPHPRKPGIVEFIK